MDWNPLAAGVVPASFQAELCRLDERQIIGKKRKKRPSTTENHKLDSIIPPLPATLHSVIPTKKVIIYQIKSIRKQDFLFLWFFWGEKKCISDEVRKEIRNAELRYRKKIEKKYSSDHRGQAWQGIESMASINQYTFETRKLISVNGVDDSDLSNAFNSFFVFFWKAWFLRWCLPTERVTPQNETVMSPECITAL